MIPGANEILEGAVPAGVVASVYGAHLLLQAREDSDNTAEAAAPDFPIDLPAARTRIVSMERSMSAANDLSRVKSDLRTQAMARRRTAALASDGSAGARIADNLMDAGVVPADATVSGYWPIGDEADALAALRLLARHGHTVALPVVVGRGRPLEFRRWTEGDEMATGSFGIREPLARAPVVEPRILLVPLLAFDRSGFRLGYGGGFYDRSLAGLRARRHTVAIGIAWSAQEVASVPHDSRDEPLDWVITERQTIRVAGSGG